jgi:small subunit ribosomal protein S1
MSDSILEKEFDLGSDEEFSEEALEEAFTSTMQDFREGEVVTGTVVEISSDWVLVDIGYKSEGQIALYEFAAMDSLNVGDTFDVFIEAPEDELGSPLLSKIKADRIKNWAHIQEIFEADGTIEGKIVRRVKGGLKVDIGIDAFMPASQLTWRPTGDLDRYIGQRMELKIIKLTKRRRNVVVSRRKLLEEMRAGEKQELLNTIEANKVIPGEVKNITDFGAFVDVGGIDGLLHVTDMSWGRVKHPSQVVSVGDKIDVMVLNFDPKTERISLGLKQKSENPWLAAEKRYPVGTVVRGKVVSMTDYGAFVQIEEGIEGMVHVSEMSWTRRVRHPSEIIAIEDEVDVMILNVAPDEEKIALGIKQTQPNPWMEMDKKYPIGSDFKGTVRNMAEYGAFVQLEEGIDGLLHVSDISWTQKINHPNEVLQKNQELEVKILSIDPTQEKISVGLKQMEQDPWEKIKANIKINTDIEVEIAKLVSFGAFARLEGGIEGLIHVSELGSDIDEKSAKPEEILSIGQKVTARVISIDNGERKIGLSIRAYEKNESAKLQEEYSVTGSESGESSEGALHAGGTLAGALAQMKASADAPAVTKVEETPAPVPVVEEPAAEAPAQEAAVEAPVEEPVAEAPVEEAAVEAPAEAAEEEAPVEEPAADDASSEEK